MASKADSDSTEGSDVLRERIRLRVAAVAGRPGLDARARMLSRVEGPVSAGLEALLEQPAREAAVLLGLVDRPAGLTVLLTERASHLTHHAGQVGLPGGRLAGPEEGPVQAALREAWEEVGLAAADVAVAGCLTPFLTGTGFSVTPVVGFVAGRFRPRPDPGEVAAVFEVPLTRILAPDAFLVSYRERLGTRIRSYELPFEGHRIWGATAALLVDFRELILDEKS